MGKRGNIGTKVPDEPSGSPTSELFTGRRRAPCGDRGNRGDRCAGGFEFRMSKFQFLGVSPNKGTQQGKPQNGVSVSTNLKRDPAKVDFGANQWFPFGIAVSPLEATPRFPSKPHTRICPLLNGHEGHLEDALQKKAHTFLLLWGWSAVSFWVPFVQVFAPGPEKVSLPFPGPLCRGIRWEDSDQPYKPQLESPKLFFEMVDAANGSLT